MTVLNKLALLVSLALAIQGCDSGTHSKITDSEIKDLYHKHKASFVELVNFCKENKSVKRLGVAPGSISLSTAVSEEADEKLVEAARKNLTLVNSETLVCARDWRLRPAPLVSVTIPLEGVGLSVSGSSKGIEFIPIINDGVRRSMEEGELESLGDEGWYIYETES